MSAIFIAYLLKFDLSLFMALQTSGYNMQMRRGSKIHNVNVTISLLGINTNLYRYFLNLGSFCLMRTCYRTIFVPFKIKSYGCALLLGYYRCAIELYITSSRSGFYMVGN
jgi:hypothetical protein